MTCLSISKTAFPVGGNIPYVCKIYSVHGRDSTGIQPSQLMVSPLVSNAVKSLLNTYACHYALINRNMY